MTKANTTIRNEKLFCLNCGGDHPLNLPIPIDRMTKKIKAFNTLHADCPQTYQEPKPDSFMSEKHRAIWWMENGETGASSKAMWRCFMGERSFDVSHPHDPDDFSRCHKLLQTVPEWKSKIHKLQSLSPQWALLVFNWDELTRYYMEIQQTKKANGMYEFMKHLIK